MMQLSQQKQINKNGVIEFMRFLFASGIVFFHTSRDFWNNQKIIGQIGHFQVTFFRKGNIGVEFFFLVSGCLLASHIYKLNSPVLSVGEETVGFLWKKVNEVHRRVLQSQRYHTRRQTSFPLDRFSTR